MPKESIATGRPSRAPRGAALTCKGWAQEAALRLLLNALDPELAENSPKLLICDSRKAARDEDSLRAILSTLPNLGDDETLIIESGALARVEHAESKEARLLLFGERLEGEAACTGLREVLRRAAATWCYAGSQAALVPAREILAAAARKYFDPLAAGASEGPEQLPLAGKVVLAASLDPVNAAFAFAATAHGAAFLAIESDSERIKRAIKGGYCEVMVNHLDEALRILKNSARLRAPASIGLLGSGAELLAELASRGIRPDLILSDPALRQRSAISQLESLGSILLDEAIYPRSLGASSRPLTCIALSGEAPDIGRLDRVLVERFSGESISPERASHHFEPTLAKHIRFQGLPARVVWFGAHDRVEFAAAVNDMVARGELRAPILFGHVFARGQRIVDSAPRDERMASMEGAAWATMERSAGKQEIIGCTAVADGSPDAKARIERVLGGRT